ncbi:unnamed protein product [Lactuca saligna]|uniref:Pentatricopeptide repeat-containing protein n=1 Tax=Lactuca saligna TaxID=75948 RepID=A0AA36A4X9_LACSI|nr:unnamed protein product [Lactuca saligna]
MPGRMVSVWFIIEKSVAIFFNENVSYNICEAVDGQSKKKKKKHKEPVQHSPTLLLYRPARRCRRPLAVTVVPPWPPCSILKNLSSQSPTLLLHRPARRCRLLLRCPARRRRRPLAIAVVPPWPPCSISSPKGFVEESKLQYLCALDMPDEALCLFKHFTQQSMVFVDGVSFNIAIDAAYKLGKLDDAMWLLEEMKNRKIKPLVFQAQAGFQGQGIQPNVGQDEGVQTEGVHDGLIQDDMGKSGVDNVGQLHTTQQTLALHKLNSLNTHHDVVLKKFRNLLKMKIRKAV